MVRIEKELVGGRTTRFDPLIFGGKNVGCVSTVELVAATTTISKNKENFRREGNLTYFLIFILFGNKLILLFF